ncbi:hypothetical protein B0T14DRAFT_598131 [Immersiella caudata]|uniref:Uncharacterized protein n=1 Tax=Immersiella caudata TaxID=314043 RepID=A0AA39XGL2_9PEZI|nr:hypothetical protein B0T14DRAFT_598131 [Immersiella caudata]
MTSKAEKKPATSRSAKKSVSARSSKAKTASSGGTEKAARTGAGDTAGSYTGTGNQTTARESTPEPRYFCGCRSCYCGSAVHAPGDLCSLWYKAAHAL